MYPFAVEILCGDTWVRTATMETQSQAEFWVDEFKKIRQQARWLTLRASDGLSRPHYHKFVDGVCWCGEKATSTSIRR